MNIVNIKDKNALPNAIEVLKSGGILVFPTDTVYGIGCSLNNIAIRKLYKIKNRPLSQPTAVLMSKKIFNQNLKEEKEKIDEIIGEYPAGRITLVFNAKSLHLKFPKILLKNGKIGIRLPNKKWLELLIDKVGPIVASSANKRGEPVPQKFNEINKEIMSKVKLVIKNSRKSSGIPSTVFDIEQEKIIRA